MPLPPAPSKRADRLSAKDFDVPARAGARAARKSAQAEAPSPKLPVIEPVAPVNGRRNDQISGKRPQTAALTHSPVAPALEQIETKVQTATQQTAGRPSPVASVRSAPAVTAKRSKKSAKSGPRKLFVLDTNVLLHDPMCLFRFEEHDIYLPMIVLEELDGHKKGMTEVARNARQTSRTLDALAGTPDADIGTGLQLDSTGHKDARGKLMFQTEALDYSLPTSLPQGKADNQILGVVEALRKHFAPREVVLVSKDINMRVKARALGLATDDYQNDKTLEDGDLLYSGSLALPIRLLGNPRPERGKLATRRTHLLQDRWPRGAQHDDQPVRLLRVPWRAQPVRPGDRNSRHDRRDQNAERLQPPQEPGVGH